MRQILRNFVQHVLLRRNSVLSTANVVSFRNFKVKMKCYVYHNLLSTIVHVACKTL